MLVEVVDWFNLPGDNVLKISGQPNVGKTMLLLQMITETIVPIEYGGKNAEVIFLDTKTSLTPDRMLFFVKNQIRRNDINVSENQIDVLARRALQNLSIYPCHRLDSFSYLANTLSVILDRNGNAKVLIVDNLVTFYWSYCATKEQVRRISFLKKYYQMFADACKKAATQTIFVFATMDDAGEAELDQIIPNRIALVRLNINNYNVFSATLYRADTKGGCKIRKYAIRDTGLYWLST